ncbi:hypothetical protein [Streptomyces sp. RFCAC02]|uniref:hypothetical protein n=1 Tax=Streptomyces sp. RFCAC02 TaxID=2499143 RepID=UPI00102233FC|nr:hypothetical protein [Streptomyces sp. RFCAC02]
MSSPLPPHTHDVPQEQALLVVDMKGYSRIPEAQMAPARADLDRMLATAFTHSGLGDGTAPEIAVKDSGDGAIFVVPAWYAARLIDPLLTHLGQELARHEQTRLASAASIRLRASVHVGPLQLPDYRGDAINVACRLVESDAVRQALTAAEDHNLLLAAAVSNTVFHRTVLAQRTQTLREHHFHRATARVNNKPDFEETCWLFVPGLVPAAISPHLTPNGTAPPDEEHRAPRRTAESTKANTSRPDVRQKAKASGKSQLIQVAGNYNSGSEPS